MRKLIVTLLLIAFSFTTAPALADSETDIGALAAVAYGQHVGAGNPTPVNGVAPAALIEATQYINNIELHVEGVPSITATGVGASGPFGRSSATISLLDALLMVNVDPSRRFRLGVGSQWINLRNFNGNDGSTNNAHLTNIIYAAGSTLPLPSHHFIELTTYVLPNVRTNLSVFDAAGVAQPTEPEQGAEIYYTASYGWTHARTTMLLGVAGLNYHTRNTNNGSLVDRNVGGAVTFEYRYRLGGVP
ncbi:MAG: hypothetical protein ABSE64_13625 [Vulcanimicrobiaceae bacterium]|jgi:hypothetical protein